MGKTGPVLIIWGQSIGAGFATNLAVSRAFPSSLKLNALLLETPFLSVRAMLEALYPQKWLPYRHLWPFLWNHLDNWSNLGVLGEKNAHVSTLPTVIILEAGRDEIVPSDHGAKLYDRCKALGIPAQKITVKGAYHNEASFRLEGKGAIASAIEAEVAKNLPGRY
jgi:acetyl esterase/lipase